VTESERFEQMEKALQRIVRWSEAYPLNTFPKPDWEKASVVLLANGIRLDSIVAYSMRHVVDDVAKIAREALA
jgi:hypothetical protein